MENSYQSTLDIKIKQKTALDEALDLKDKGEFKKALELAESEYSFEAFRLRAEILTRLGDFESAVKNFDNALNLQSDDDLIIEKVDALYRWAKISYFPENDYDKALNLVNLALDIIPDSADDSEIWFLKGEIYQSLNQHIDARKCFLKAENRIGELEILEDELNQFEIHKNDVLINITGVNFYKGLAPFKKGLILKLVRDEDNEHDRDAIAVMIDDEIVGYVANSKYTLINDVKGASEIKKSIKDTTTAEVLFIFQNEFVISKVTF